MRNGIPELDAPDAAPTRATPARRRLRPGRPRAAAGRRARASCARSRDIAAVAWIGDAPGDEAAPLRAAGIPLTGWLPHAEDALAELARATVLLHYSAWDGAPLAVLEAIARDVVVVASDIPPNRELLGPDQVCAGEAAAIALIRAVIADAELRERLLRSQRERGRTRGAGRMVQDCLDLYADVLGPAVSKPAATLAIARNIGSGPWS